MDGRMAPRGDLAVRVIRGRRPWWRRVWFSLRDAWRAVLWH